MKKIILALSIMCLTACSEPEYYVVSSCSTEEAKLLKELYDTCTENLTYKSTDNITQCLDRSADIACTQKFVKNPNFDKKEEGL